MELFIFGILCFLTPHVIFVMETKDMGRDETTFLLWLFSKSSDQINLLRNITLSGMLFMMASVTGIF